MKNLLPNEEFRFSRRKTYLGTFTHGETYICAKGLSRYINLPGGINVIWLVFTVKPMRGKASFKIVRSTTYSFCLSGVKIGLYYSFRRLLEKMYIKGYRYVHVEYE